MSWDWCRGPSRPGAFWYETPPDPKPANYVPKLNPGHSAFESMALFLVMSFAGQLTGGHCNPIITLALLISRGNKMTPKIAFVYMCSQFAGAIAGGGIGNFGTKVSFRTD